MSLTTCPAVPVSITTWMVIGAMFCGWVYFTLYVYTAVLAPASGVRVPLLLLALPPGSERTGGSAAIIEKDASGIGTTLLSSVPSLAVKWNLWLPIARLLP